MGGRVHLDQGIEDDPFDVTRLKELPLRAQRTPLKDSHHTVIVLSVITGVTLTVCLVAIAAVIGQRLMQGKASLAEMKAFLKSKWTILAGPGVGVPLTGTALLSSVICYFRLVQKDHFEPHQLCEDHAKIRKRVFAPTGAKFPKGLEGFSQKHRKGDGAEFLSSNSLLEGLLQENPSSSLLREEGSDIALHSCVQLSEKTGNEGELMEFLKSGKSFDAEAVEAFLTTANHDNEATPIKETLEAYKEHLNDLSQMSSQGAVVRGLETAGPGYRPLLKRFRVQKTLMSQIRGLKEGQQRIILAYSKNSNQDGADRVFYIVTKTSKGYELKITGNGPAMRAFSEALGLGLDAADRFYKGEESFVTSVAKTFAEDDFFPILLNLFDETTGFGVRLKKKAHKPGPNGEDRRDRTAVLLKKRFLLEIGFGFKELSATEEQLTKTSFQELEKTLGLGLDIPLWVLKYAQHEDCWEIPDEPEKIELERPEPVKFELRGDLKKNFTKWLSAKKEEGEKALEYAESRLQQEVELYGAKTGTVATACCVGYEDGVEAGFKKLIMPAVAIDGLKKEGEQFASHLYKILRDDFTFTDQEQTKIKQEAKGRLRFESFDIYTALFRHLSFDTQDLKERKEKVKRFILKTRLIILLQAYHRHKSKVVPGSKEFKAIKDLEDFLDSSLQKLGRDKILDMESIQFIRVFFITMKNNLTKPRSSDISTSRHPNGIKPLSLPVEVASKKPEKVAEIQDIPVEDPRDLKSLDDLELALGPDGKPIRRVKIREEGPLTLEDLHNLQRKVRSGKGLVTGRDRVFLDNLAKAIDSERKFYQRYLDLYLEQVSKPDETSPKGPLAEFQRDKIIAILGQTYPLFFLEDSKHYESHRKALETYCTELRWSKTHPADSPYVIESSFRPAQKDFETLKKHQDIRDDFDKNFDQVSGLKKESFQGIHPLLFLKHELERCFSLEYDKKHFEMNSQDQDTLKGRLDREFIVFLDTLYGDSKYKDDPKILPWGGRFSPQNLGQVLFNISDKKQSITDKISLQDQLIRAAQKKATANISELEKEKKKLEEEKAKQRQDEEEKKLPKARFLSEERLNNLPAIIKQIMVQRDGEIDNHRKEKATLEAEKARLEQFEKELKDIQNFYNELKGFIEGKNIGKSPLFSKAYSEASAYFTRDSCRADLPKTGGFNAKWKHFKDNFGLGLKITDLNDMRFEDHYSGTRKCLLLKQRNEIADLLQTSHVSQMEGLNRDFSKKNELQRLKQDNLLLFKQWDTCLEHLKKEASADLVPVDGGKCKQCPVKKAGRQLWLHNEAQEGSLRDLFRKGVARAASNWEGLLRGINQKLCQEVDEQDPSSECGLLNIWEALAGKLSEQKGLSDIDLDQSREEYAEFLDQMVEAFKANRPSSLFQLHAKLEEINKTESFNYLELEKLAPWIESAFQDVDTIPYTESLVYAELLRGVSEKLKNHLIEVDKNFSHDGYGLFLKIHALVMALCKKEPEDPRAEHLFLKKAAGASALDAAIPYQSYKRQPFWRDKDGLLMAQKPASTWDRFQLSVQGGANQDSEFRHLSLNLMGHGRVIIEDMLAALQFFQQFPGETRGGVRVTPRGLKDYGAAGLSGIGGFDTEHATTFTGRVAKKTVDESQQTGIVLNSGRFFEILCDQKKFHDEIINKRGEEASNAFKTFLSWFKSGGGALPTNLKLKGLPEFENPVFGVIYLYLLMEITEEPPEDHLNQFLKQMATVCKTLPFSRTGEKLEAWKKSRYEKLLAQQGRRAPMLAQSCPRALIEFLIEDFKAEFGSKEPNIESQTYSPINPAKMRLSKDVLSEFLQVFKKENPQIELLGFLDKFPQVLKHADFRVILEAMMTDSSLLSNTEGSTETKGDSILPIVAERAYAEQKVEELTKQENPDLDALIFFVQVSNKLQLIELELSSDEYVPHYSKGDSGLELIFKRVFAKDPVGYATWDRDRKKAWDEYKENKQMSYALIEDPKPLITERKQLLELEQVRDLLQSEIEHLKTLESQIKDLVKKKKEILHDLILIHSKFEIDAVVQKDQETLARATCLEKQYSELQEAKKKLREDYQEKQKQKIPTPADRQKYQTEMQSLNKQLQDLERKHQDVVKLKEKYLFYRKRTYLLQALYILQLQDLPIVKTIEATVAFITAQTTMETLGDRDELLLNEVKRRYSSLMDVMEKDYGAEFDDKSYFHVLADLVCKNLDISLKKGDEWKRKEPLPGHQGPIFENEVLEINFRTAELRCKKQNKTMLKALPEIVVNSPEFERAFRKDIVMSETTFFKEVGSHPNIMVYSFVDSKGFSCQVDVTDNPYSPPSVTCYRHLMVPKVVGNGKIEGTKKRLLQVSSLKKELEEKDAKKAGALEKLGSWINRVTGEKEEKEVVTPAIFEQNDFFVDPENQNRGFLFNKQGKLLFECVLSRSQITQIIDYRDEKQTQGPYTCTTADLCAHPAVQALMSFDDPKNILVFADKKGVVKVELTAYNIVFEMHDNRLICPKDSLPGISTELYLKHDATREERFELDHSLRLQPVEVKGNLDKFMDSYPVIIAPHVSAIQKDHAATSVLKALFGGAPSSSMSLRKSKSGASEEASEGPEPFVAFEVYTDPASKSCIFKEESKFEDSIALANQYFLLDDLMRADRMLRLALGQNPLEHLVHLKNRKAIIEMLNYPPSSSREASLKLRLGLELKELIASKPRFRTFEEQLDFSLARDGVLILKYMDKHGYKKLDLHKEVLSKEELQKIETILEKQVGTNPLSKTADALSKLRSFIKDHKKLPQGKKQQGHQPNPNAQKSEIETLEDQLLKKPYQDLSTKDSSTSDGTFKMLPYKDWVPLLEFDPAKKEDPLRGLRDYFEQSKAKVPELNPLSGSDFAKGKANKEDFEKVALEQYQEAIEKFKEKPEALPVLTKDPDTLKKLLKNLEKQRESYWVHSFDLSNKLETFLHTGKDLEEQLLLSNERRYLSANLEELKLALLKDGFAGFSDLVAQNKLPPSFDDEDFTKLKEILLEYLQCQVTTHLITRSLEKLDKMIEEYQHEQFVGPKQWKENDLESSWTMDSKELFYLLNYKRQYDCKKYPELLLFESYKFSTFRDFSKECRQVGVFEDMIQNPDAVQQAPTGFGKTKFLTNMLALKKPKGDNLVVVQVTDPLYAQTLKEVKHTVGTQFQKKVYALKFDLTQRMYDYETVLTEHPDPSQPPIEEIKQISIFKQMYRNMLHVIEEKGVVITNYNSMPLLQEKFIKLLLENSEKKKEEISPLDKEHFIYLQKILQLLKTRGEVVMDEVDGPARPIRKIQTLVNSGNTVPMWMVDESLKIFKWLEEHPDLPLKSGMQDKILSETRDTVIKQLAEFLAKDFASQAQVAPEKQSALQKILEDYIQSKPEEEECFRRLLKSENRDLLGIFLDKNEENSELLDRLAFAKDQITTFLPLTLAKGYKSRYIKTPDGEKILPCHDGIVQERSQFGSLVEKMNYYCQSYIQKGVEEEEVDQWLVELNQIADSNKSSDDISETISEYLNDEIFKSIKGVTYQFKSGEIEQKIDGKEGWEPLSAEELTKLINNDSHAKHVMLQRRLGKIEVSGRVISMSPSENFSMFRKAAGMSATLGATHALHRDLKVDYEKANFMKAAMLLRVLKKLKPEIKTYDPKHPEEMIKESKGLSVVIDAAGALREKSPQEVEEAMKEANPSLECVILPEGKKMDDRKIDCLSTKGAYFSQPFTRGADIELGRFASGILIESGEGTIDDLIQSIGRLRKETQKLQVYVSNFDKNIKTIEDLIVSKLFFEAKRQAQDALKGRDQGLEEVVKNDAMQDLLEAEDLTAATRKFFEEKSYQEEAVDGEDPITRTLSLYSLFVTESKENYSASGAYFMKHQHVPVAMDTIKILEKEAAVRTKEAECLLDLQGVRKDEFTKNFDRILDKDDSKKSVPLTSVLEKTTKKVNHDLGEELEVQVELQLEAEEEVEEELELQLHLQQEEELQIEDTKDPAEPAPLTGPRPSTTRLFFANEWLDPAFHKRIVFTDTFLDPESKHFDPREWGDSKTLGVGLVHLRDGKVIITDCLEPLNGLALKRAQEVHKPSSDQKVDREKRWDLALAAQNNAPQTVAQQPNYFKRSLSYGIYDARRKMMVLDIPSEEKDKDKTPDGIKNLSKEQRQAAIKKHNDHIDRQLGKVLQDYRKLLVEKGQAQCGISMDYYAVEYRRNEYEDLRTIHIYKDSSSLTPQHPDYELIIRSLVENYHYLGSWNNPLPSLSDIQEKWEEQPVEVFEQGSGKDHRLTPEDIVDLDKIPESLRKMLTELHFLIGQIDGYTDWQIEYLRDEFVPKGPRRLKNFMKEKVLKNKETLRFFESSQLYKEVFKPAIKREDDEEAQRQVKEAAKREKQGTAARQKPQAPRVPHKLFVKPGGLSAPAF